MIKLHYDHVSKTYPNASHPAVNEISLEVEEGEFVVFFGPSGCGKTTLLKMTNRLFEPSGGQILLEGADVRGMDPVLLRRRMGYVIQQVGLFPHLTVGENVAVVPDLLGWDKPRIASRVEELLALVNLPAGEFARRYPAQLSGGQQQRVGLARALAGDPEVLLMDEPFGAIDALTRGSLQEEILALHSRLRKTILFVTHDVDEALRLADRIALLREGRVEQYGTPCELLAHPASPFVSQILGAEDRVRQMSLLRVASVMEYRHPREATGKNPLAPATAGTGAPVGAGVLPRSRVIHPQSNLREALSLFLQPGIDELAVIEDGQVLGRLTLTQLREAACLPAPE
jgi:osmoprotectant transport system ATP-binding protein